MKRCEVDKDKLSPMMLQYLDIKEKYEDTLVFFRLGDFYELFFEDAIIASRELELTLTGKQAGLDEKVPMCGVPYHAYATYVNTLVDKGYKVSICEQLEDAKEKKGMVNRDVVQVITKGTRLDDLLDSKENNYICNLYYNNYCYGIGLCDVSTGDISLFLLEDDKNKIIKEIIKYNIKEVIVNNETDREIVEILRSKYNILVTISSDILENDYSYIYEDIEDIRLINVIKHLLNYIVLSKKGDLTHLKKANVIKLTNYLEFDNNTIKNLELIETIRKNDRKYSLFWYLDKCKTAMGSRYLKKQITMPLRDKKILNQRYDIITKLSCEFILRDDLIKLLDDVYDLERLSSRIVYGNLNAKDLIQLKKSFKALPDINNILEKIEYPKTIKTFTDLYKLLDKAIVDDPPFSLHEGNLIKKGYNSTLDELIDIKSNSKDYILEIEKKEKERTNIKNLKVRFNKVFGYYIEISKGQIKEIKEEYGYIRKQTLTNCERFITNELKEKENIILTSEEKIIKLEYKLFMDVREVIKRQIKDIQEVATILSEVDMLQAFSIVSDNRKLVRPNLVDDNNLRLISSRHPVIDEIMKDKYVDNDIIMDNSCNILLITGPNMAGKSTYMRQCAIIVIMAQIGCFVPCKEADIPIFDKIFTRIGASDDLVSGESTFMVEMKEANEALKEATENSLILFDELGRGTATYDGMSLAQAILEYIHDNIKAKCLFSTHYHELTILEKNLLHLKNVYSSIKEENGNLIFLHKVKNGYISKSYGIQVARLAHLPDEVIKRSKDILEVYEKKSTKKEVFTQTSLFSEDFLENNKNEIEEEIKKINPLEMTPMEALKFLYELKQKIKEK